jgi:tetratricopeptide (TPR) repeat protein/tRNA A-37 threonylcarbamoyl transferase component Bud32
VSVAQDEELRREVALKEIQPQYADHTLSRSRFVLEAEVTGGLEHPGIVPVYGLGCYPDGRPFYAMRFIRGVSLREAIQQFHAADVPGRDPGERELTLRGLLRRFVDVCNAIAYAHSRGVLHRDIKPDNVMLGAFGETLVVDWGLAKATGEVAEGAVSEQAPLRPAAADGSAPTRVGSAIGTPAYMSPEQAEGRVDQLGPASDIYSLGATLYSLLTGRAPFTGAELGPVLGAVRRGDFTPPRKVKPAVPAALEAVCLKAMALRPANRYPTPIDLKSDIEHWLADEPVSAWREPFRVRAGRWARRHQALVAATAASLLVAILAGGAGAWWLERQWAERRHDVETALGKVAELQGQARWAEARAVLEEAELRLGEGGPRDLKAGLDRARSDLDLVARLDAIRLKRATLVDGRFQNAAANRECEEVFRNAGLGEVGSDAAAAAAWVSRAGARGALVAALDDWAAYTEDRGQRAWLLEVARRADPGPWRDAVRDPAVWDDRAALARLARDEQVAEQSLVLLTVLGSRLMHLGGDAERPLRAGQGRRPDDFWVNFYLGNALARRAPEEAVSYFRAALALRPGTAAVHCNLGAALSRKGLVDEAVLELRRAVELDPGDAVAHTNLGVVLKTAGKPEEAIAEFHRALELDPDYAYAHANLGAALGEKGQLDEAVAACRRAVAISPKFPLAYSNLGSALYDQRRLNEALVELHRAIALDPEYAPAHTCLGHVLRAQGRPDEALAAYRRALASDPRYAPAYHGLGNALGDKGRLDEAIVVYRRAAELDPKNATIYYNLGNTLRGRGRLDEAVAVYQRAVKINPNFGAAHNNLGVALLDLHRLDEAIATFHRALASDPKYAPAYDNLGNALSKKGRWGEAVTAFHQAIKLDDKNANIYSNLGAALRAQGRPDEAVAVCRRAVELDPKNAYAFDKLGGALGDKGRWGEAVAAHHRAAELDPNDARVRSNLGCALRADGRLDEAVADFRRAVELAPNLVEGHSNLGMALAEQGRLDEAIAACRWAVELGPKNAVSHGALGQVLLRKGQFAEARQAIQRCLQLLPPGDPRGQFALRQLRQCEEMLPLDKKLAAFLKGDARPADAREQLSLARLCAFKKRYAGARHFYAAAFAAQPKLADDLRSSYRYNAACATALTAAGQGQDAIPLAETERAQMRQQALDWLRSDLTQWAKQMENSNLQARAAVQTTLRHWQKAPDLTGVRDTAALVKLPAAERAEWQKLWADAAVLLKKAEAGGKE